MGEGEEIIAHRTTALVLSDEPDITLESGTVRTLSSLSLSLNLFV
jgi:hypothetical protein